jgi:transcriptional regulator with XRE-family HTH domain
VGATLAGGAPCRYIVATVADSPLTLGRTLAALRAAHGWTQAELGRVAGVDKAQVSRYERDVDEPSTRVLESLLAALGVSHFELHRLRDVLDGMIHGRPAPARRTPISLEDLSFLAAPRSSAGTGRAVAAAGEEPAAPPADEEVERVARDAGRLAERLVRLHFTRLGKSG